MTESIAVLSQEEATTCNCITEFDAKLSERNLKLDTTILIRPAGGSMEFLLMPTLSTVKLDANKRGKVRRVVPNYCPFCGIKYPTKNE